MRRILLSFLLFASVHVFAGDSYKLVALRSTGSKEYTSEEVVAATKLKIGSMVTGEELQSAANSLAASGAFASVTFEFKGVGSGLAVNYIVEDAEKYVGCRYENFVWASDDELTAYIKSRFPLFHGRVTQTGEMLNSVSDVLGQWLASKEIPGKVEWRLHSPDEGRTVDSVSFVVDGVTVRVKSAQLENAVNLTNEESAQVLKPIKEAGYELALAQDGARYRLQAIYARKGFLKADVGRPKLSVVSTNPKEPEVAVSIPVNEGRQYRLASIAWAGNSVVATDTLTKKLNMKTGAPANLAQLEDDLVQVRKIYDSKGYLATSIKPMASFNDAESSVAISLMVTEGPQFQMGSLLMTGVPENIQRKLLSNWKLAAGEAYSPEYVKEYLKKNASLFEGRSVRIREGRKPDNTVDLTLEF